jgi:predicted ferric reductase
MERSQGQDRVVQPFLESRTWGILLLGAYAVALCLPPVIAALFSQEEEGEAFLTELGKVFALVGVALLVLQVVLAARIRWIERPFGLDVLFRFHRRMAVCGAGLLLLHPVLLAAGSGHWGLLTRLHLPWSIVLGKVTLALLLLLVVLALFREKLNLEFEKWRLSHNAAVAVLALGFVHSWVVGEDLHRPPLRVLWVILAAAAGTAYVHHRFLVPWRARRRSWVVTDVRRESHDVWTLEMEPPAGEARYDYRPGQFQFVTLLRGDRGLPVEEHPFTIASSPTEPNLRASIKESGDFTKTIGLTRPGDRVAVDGPYGRFSYTLHPQESDLVMIAGGIGITPLLSMLRHMHDTETPAQVLILWANRTPADIGFRDELNEITVSEKPGVRVVHVLTRPGEGWHGETGRLDRETIERIVGPEAILKSYYVCGPRAMTDGVLGALRELGVPPGRIHYERFAL